MCVCAFSFRRESPDMILRDKPLISEVVLSDPRVAIFQQISHEDRCDTVLTRSRGNIFQRAGASGRDELWCTANDAKCTIGHKRGRRVQENQCQQPGCARTLHE
jgi:hypothetical protein